MLKIIVFIVKLFVWSLLPALALYLTTGSVVLSVMLWIVTGGVEVLSRLEVHRDLNKENPYRPIAIYSDNVKSMVAPICYN